MISDERIARDLCGVGCSCSDENAERCKFAGRMGQVCTRQEAAIIDALRAAEIRGLEMAKEIIADAGVDDSVSNVDWAYDQALVHTRDAIDARIAKLKAKTMFVTAEYK